MQQFNETLIVEESTIAGNTAEQGGGVFNSNDHVEILNSVIENNQATNGNGGGVYTQLDSGPREGSTLLISGSTFSGNQASVSGGAIYNINDHVELFNSTVSGNHAGDLGGGIATR